MSSVQGEIQFASFRSCVWEATARKVGNVHRYADFADTSYLDFVFSAKAIEFPLAHAWRCLVTAPHEHISLGESIAGGIRITQHVVGRNTNLGMILLLMPLAATWSADPTRSRTMLPGVLSAASRLMTRDGSMKPSARPTPAGLAMHPSKTCATSPRSRCSKR